jgi:hypothetical protein
VLISQATIYGMEEGLMQREIATLANHASFRRNHRHSHVIYPQIKRSKRDSMLAVHNP